MLSEINDDDDDDDDDDDIIHDNKRFPDDSRKYDSNNCANHLLTCANDLTRKVKSRTVVSHQTLIHRTQSGYKQEFVQRQRSK